MIEAIGYVKELIKGKGSIGVKTDVAKIPDFKTSGQYNDGVLKDSLQSQTKSFNITDSAKIPDFKASKIVDSLQEMLNFVKEKSPFSDKINSFIKTLEELKVYIDAGLKESIVNGKLVLKDNSIDPDLVDGKGLTNLERMKKGLAPLDEKGEPYNLHHVGQKNNSPLAELKNGTHKRNDSALHDSSIKKSGIDRTEFAKERAEHWKARAEEIEAKNKEGE